MAIEYFKRSTNEKQRLDDNEKVKEIVENTLKEIELRGCLLYTSPSPRDATLSRMPSSA